MVEVIQSDTLQDRLTRIFDDARGSDTLVDLLSEFEFESSRELAEALTVWASSKLFQETAVKIATLEAQNKALREALEPFRALLDSASPSQNDRDAATPMEKATHRFNV